MAGMKKLYDDLIINNLYSKCNAPVIYAKLRVKSLAKLISARNAKARRRLETRKSLRYF